MKSKPVKHKTTNTFRFVPFAERINSIDIRHAALYHIEHQYTKQPEENETHFSLAIQKWHGLNLTVNFKKFRREVHGIVTVPQLVHKKNEVIEILERYLNLEDELCLQPLLEILVSLAKDLREDFYPHFPRFLDVLIKLLDTKDAERLEWTLVCLAFLFKVLKPYLKKDIAVILKRIIPLLSETKPQYINNFAAESFAFVARDIRDKKKFITLILDYLLSNDDAIVGSGHLMFEILRGVSNKFHSCIETFLPVLLQHLKEVKQHQDVLFKVLTQTIEDSLQVIAPKEYAIFWTSVLKFTEDILKDEDGTKGLEYILRLAGQVIEHHNGKYLTNPPQFVLLLIKVICEQSSESVLEVCAQIGAVLLLSPDVHLSQEHAGIIVKVLLPIPYPNILINFVQNVIDYSQFDLHILPPFLNFVLQSQFDSDSMCAFSKICLRKSPLSKNGIKLLEWVKYPIDFGQHLSKFMEHFDAVINEDMESIVENPVKLLNVLFCLPHIEKVDVGYCIKALSGLIGRLLNVLASYNIECQTDYNKFHCDNTALSRCARRILFILVNAMESAVHISGCKNLREICDIERLLPVVLPCAADPNYLPALHLLDLFLTAYEHEHGMTYPHLCLVDSYLKSNVTSPFHIVRLLTTHVYKLFENVDELNKTQNGDKFSIFSYCYNVESITPSIQEYRLQVNTLQKMSFNTPQYAAAKGTEFHLFALNYMLGILHVNFKLLWEPVSEFIAGFGNALTAEEFWPPFYAALQSSFQNAKKNLKKFQFEEEIETGTDIIKDLFADYNSIAERPDLYNYRNLLLKIMTNCIQVCEARNRDVVVLFLSFIEEEFRRDDRANALRVDVQVHDNTMQVDEDPEQSAQSVQQMIEAVEEPANSASGKVIFKTLINVMQVLAQFKNPRALHKEPVFWELYMEFLKNKNPGLQKYALDCVLNYKNKGVVPYKNNLQNLVDEKKFKDEMTQFKITEEAKSIHPDDREHVVPLILRILYGKMTSKQVADKKGGGQARRSLVMRYLAGCNENELQIFIEMAFSQFKQYMELSPKEIHKDVMATLDLKSLITPGKLHSVLNLFDVVREYFGGYMSNELLSKLFNIFYGISSIISGVLAQGDKVHVGYVKILKNLRTIALSTLRKLFEQFDKYPWTQDELYVLFETLLWPLISKLHIEGVNNPTPLLKLLNTWCLNPRYYVLLVTRSDQESLSPLSALFKLLSAPKLSPVVVNMILDMVEKLLTLTEDEEDKETPPIESFSTVAIEYDKQTTNEANVASVNFGSKILIPHIPSILAIMKRRFANTAKANSVNKRDLLVLARVSELVAAPELCDELLALLLPILVKKVCLNTAEENMEHAVNTIINLLGHSNTPQVYIKDIAVLFNKVAPVDVRKLLIKLLGSIADRADNNKVVLKRIAHIVGEMNAFNKRWIEQPDFDRRLDAYKAIYKLADDDEIDVDLAILIVNNCFYSIRTEKDIGLRDGAAFCLKKILPKLLLKYKSTPEGQFLVRDTVLSLISTGIRDTKNEILRNESIALLGTLARECAEADAVLADLAALASQDDAEVDFFENMCHLQVHRRVRALMRFCKVAKKLMKCPTPRTLTNFILPLASMYLCDEQYADKNSLVDASVEAVAACCRLLPWYHYEVVLKLYLNKMRNTTDHQKQLTRLLIGIIDAFHFDFSKAKDIELPKALVNNIVTGKIEFKHETDKQQQNQEVTETPEKANTTRETEENVPGEDIPENEMETDQKEEQVKEDQLDLEEELKAADKEVIEEDPKEACSVPAFERITSVSPSVARRIVRSLAAGLLPQLTRAIGKLTEHEASHKLGRRRAALQREAEELQRLPLALALVQLLQRLPAALLLHRLPGIFVQLCSFLKSPLKRVRLVARDIVKKVMEQVGPARLHVLLRHLALLLTRGYHVHVLAATLHAVLHALRARLTPGHLAHNLRYILDVCADDLFGARAEEREVDKLTRKTPEAKPSKKTFVSLAIVARSVGENCLVDLLLPFKQALETRPSRKVVLKVREALQSIGAGLVANEFLAAESLFLFLHGVASAGIPQLVLGTPRRVITEEQRERMQRAKPDCFLIPEPPRRSREAQARQVRAAGSTGAHVLVEFSLNLLHVILKRERLPRADCRAFVDPLIPLLADAAKSDRVKVATLALKCVTTLWATRIATPTLKELAGDIVESIFSILHKYGTAEISKQEENWQLVRAAFKAVTTLVRHVPGYPLQAGRLRVLLLYAEQELRGEGRAAGGGALLRGILGARLEAPELHQVMDLVAEVAILSESGKTREECRGIFVQYLTGYALGKKLERFLQFFLSQLQFELQHGRESALQLLDMLVAALPAAQLTKHGASLLLSLGGSMVGDPAVEVRAAAAGAIERLLGRLPALERNKLFSLLDTLLHDDKPAHWELAAQLATRFVVSEGSGFLPRLPSLLPTLARRLLPHSEGRFVRAPAHAGEEEGSEGQAQRDHCLIQMLNLVDKIMTTCPACLTNNKYWDDVDDIASQCQALLAHGHAWVRLGAARVLGAVLGAEGAGGRGWLGGRLKSLVLDLCAQYTVHVGEDMATLVTAVMFQILKLVHARAGQAAGTAASDAGTAVSDAGTAASDEAKEAPDMRWILFQLRRAVNTEVARAPNNMTIRTAIFSMWVHLVSWLRPEHVAGIADVVLPPLARELSVADPLSAASPARAAAARAGKRLRRRLGEHRYARMLAEATTRLHVKRAERKRLLLQEKVTNPEKAAKRKLQSKEKKRAAKKMKLEALRGKRARPRKRRAEDIDLEDALLNDD